MIWFGNIADRNINDLKCWRHSAIQVSSSTNVICGWANIEIVNMPCDGEPACMENYSMAKRPLSEEGPKVLFLE